jgi:hypothetical protein
VVVVAAAVLVVNKTLLQVEMVVLRELLDVLEMTKALAAAAAADRLTLVVC